MSDKEQARFLYEANKKWISENIDNLHSKELCMWSKKQDELYLISVGEKEVLREQPK